MRLTSRFAAFIALAAIAQAGEASIVRWDLSGQLTDSRSVGLFSAPAVGSAFSLVATIDSDAPRTGFATYGVYLDVFQTLELRVGASTLTLDPDAEPFQATYPNYLVVDRVSGSEQLFFRASLTDGVSPLLLLTAIFRFPDLNAYRYDSLTAPFPALGSALLKQFEVAVPNQGGTSRVLLGEVQSATATVVPVPEPASVVLMAVGLAAITAGARRRVPARTPAP